MISEEIITFALVLACSAAWLWLVRRRGRHRRWPAFLPDFQCAECIRLSAETSALLKALAAAREALRGTPTTDPAHTERKLEFERLRVRYRAARQREDAHRITHGYDPGSLLGWSPRPEFAGDSSPLLAASRSRMSSSPASGWWQVKLLTARPNRTRIRQTGITFQARNRAQILVNPPEVAVGHVPERRPRHDL